MNLGRLKMALRRRTKEEEQANEIVQEITDEVESPLVPAEKKTYDMSTVISTGSTLLDLAISGGRRREGGIPGGVILEIAGPAGSGKTAILASIAAHTQSLGGQVMFLDPEARFDQEYAEIYGIQLQSNDYHR